MGINPNRYMCAIEALMTRIAKGQGMPAINTIVIWGTEFPEASPAHRRP